MKTGYLYIVLIICSFFVPEVVTTVVEDKEKEIPKAQVIDVYVDKPIEQDSAYIKLDSTIQHTEKNRGWTHNVIKKKNEK
jgi:hypothetical protein